MTNYLKVAQAKKDLLNQIEQDRQSLLSDAKRNGVQVVHIFDQDNPKGGLTIAFRKVKPNQISTNMVEVAVATCSHADTFSRKLGTQLALSAFFNGPTIMLPLSSGYRDEDLNGRVKQAFMSMWDTIKDTPVGL